MGTPRRVARMSDVVAVALITGIGTAIVAIAGVVGQIWGPAWRDERDRRATAEHASEALRYERALEFVEAVAKVTRAQTMGDVFAASLARARFIATLRPGEQAAEVFTRRMLDVARSDAVRGEKPRILDQHSDLLFRWLRGESKVDELQMPGVRMEIEVNDTVGITDSVDASRGNEER